MYNAIGTNVNDNWCKKWRASEYSSSAWAHDIHQGEIQCDNWNIAHLNNDRWIFKDDIR